VWGRLALPAQGHREGQVLSLGLPRVGQTVKSRDHRYLVPSALSQTWQDYIACCDDKSRQVTLWYFDLSFVRNLLIERLGNHYGSRSLRAELKL